MMVKRLARTLAPKLSRRPTSDTGFSLIEVTVAVGIFAVVMLLLSTMLASGMRGVLLGKRREVAVQEANKLVEYARSLSFTEVGLAQNDPTIDTDPAIVDIGGVKHVLVDPATNAYEPIIWATNPAGHPYNPHTQTVSRGSTKLTSFVYVTGVDTSGDGNYDMARIVARVVWDETGTQGPANEIRLETFVDENGVLPTGSTQHGGTPPPGPTSTPCPAPPCHTGSVPMTAGASATGGTAEIRTDRGSLTSLVNAVLPTSPVRVSLPTLSGSTKLRAVSQTTCSAASTLLEGPTGSYGKHTRSVTADDDARTETEEQPDDVSWEGTGDPVSGTDPVSDLLVETTLASPVSCHASARDEDGLPPADDALPYEKGTGSGPGTSTANNFLTLTEDVSNAGLPSNVLTLVRFGTATNSQEIDHRMNGAVREISSTASGTLNETQIMRIPGLFEHGLVNVSGFSYSASSVASEGTPAAAPNVTTPGGLTIKIYDPSNQLPACTNRNSGYCFVTVDPGGPGFGGFNSSFSASATTNAGLTQLSYDIDVQAFPPTEAPLDGVLGPNGERTWQAAYTGISVSVHLKILVNVLGTTVLLTDSVADVSLANVAVNGCAGCV